MRRLSWIFIALFALGLWLWAQPRAPGPVSVSGPVAIRASDAPRPAAARAISQERPSQDTPVSEPDAVRAPARYPAFLPLEAHAVLDRIAQGGPFEYRQDGGVFQNRERQLPPQARGYYREYTVETPGSSDRGARRIITGGEPPHEYWYTDDHYRSFRRFEVSP